MQKRDLTPIEGERYLNQLEDKERTWRWKGKRWSRREVVKRCGSDGVGKENYIHTEASITVKDGTSFILIFILVQSIWAINRAG